MIEHPRSSPPIACPTRSRTEEHPCWWGRGTRPQSGRIHPVMTVQHTPLLDAANSAAAPASREEASKWESAVVQDTVTSHMSDLPARHGINVNPSGRFPSERLRPDGSLDTGTHAMTSLRWWCLTVLPGARLQTRLWRPNDYGCPSPPRLHIREEEGTTGRSWNGARNWRGRVDARGGKGVSGVNSNPADPAMRGGGPLAWGPKILVRIFLHNSLHAPLALAIGTKKRRAQLVSLRGGPKFEVTPTYNRWCKNKTNDLVKTKARHELRVLYLYTPFICNKFTVFHTVVQSS